MAQKLLLGQVLHFSGNPLTDGWADTAHHNSAGAVLVEGGMIADMGGANELRSKYPSAALFDYGQDLIVAGFVDAHVHYPQTAMIASWGKRLVDWLNTYTFPEEMRLADPDYAHQIAGRYCDLALAHGTTTMASFCTTSPISVTAFFEAANQRGMRAVGGKTCMDRNAPDGLIDTAQRAYDESKALIDAWHEKRRITYAITPRFAPTSTPAQLEALGALWAERPSCLMQTHLSEQVEEIDWVKSLYPDACDYLNVYENFGLLGQRGIYGHAIHLTEREIARLSEQGAAIAHCPTSNAFIGSGLCDVMGLARAGVKIGLASDIGGGSNFSMLHTMAAGYEIAQLRGQVLHPVQLMWLASAGAADTLHLGDKIGHLSAGHEADICVLNLQSTPAIAQRNKRADTIWDALFATIMMGDDRAIRGVWVAGENVAPMSIFEHTKDG